jgi:hypothetical protein
MTRVIDNKFPPKNLISISYLVFPQITANAAPGKLSNFALEGKNRLQGMRKEVLIAA